MTLQPNELRVIADREPTARFAIDAKTKLVDAANEIDALRHKVALLNIELTFATNTLAKVKSDVS